MAIFRKIAKGRPREIFEKWQIFLVQVHKAQNLRNTSRLMRKLNSSNFKLRKKPQENGNFSQNNKVGTKAKFLKNGQFFRSISEG